MLAYVEIIYLLSFSNRSFIDIGSYGHIIIISQIPLAFQIIVLFC